MSVTSCSSKSTGKLGGRGSSGRAIGDGAYLVSDRALQAAAAAGSKAASTNADKLVFLPRQSQRAQKGTAALGSSVMAAYAAAQNKANSKGGEGKATDATEAFRRLRPAANPDCSNLSDSGSHASSSTSSTPSHSRTTPSSSAAASLPAAAAAISANVPLQKFDGGGPPPDTVVFLDVDGVLHSLYGDDLFKPSSCAVFEKIVRQTGAAIVLSSTWRTQQRSVNMLNQFLCSRRLPQIVERTKDLSAAMRRHVPREREICEWLDRHPEVKCWIAIDDMDLQSDDNEWARRLRGHFVHTSSNIGLIAHNGEQAIRLMAQQAEKAQIASCGGAKEHRRQHLGRLGELSEKLPSDGREKRREMAAYPKLAFKS
eukprot:TRINITY_DN8723_c0_g1_i2.p1 TRINITY_DN8723_c0_g1~~TRINITY_DN8723_c0_g1_i2.p1  ORF type:complete len:370 (+),score=92.54 TRINITY_DN8723_c0_g1_i2:103-1212(+)